jgi:hypothetical protein
MRTNWLEKFNVPPGYNGSAIGTISNIKFDLTPEVDPVAQAFFTPSSFVEPTSLDKANWYASHWLWADLDSCNTWYSLLPPTMIVRSGHGFHLYFKMKEAIRDLEKLEYFNKVIGSQTTPRDNKCWNANRLLRIPNSTNTKNEPVAVVLLEERDVAYSEDDITAVSQIEKSVRQLIENPTLDSGQWASRSELDYYIMNYLKGVGASTELIKTIWAYAPIGSKAKEHSNTAHYINVTLDNLDDPEKPKPKPANPHFSGLTEGKDGYWHGKAKISNFLIEPKNLFATATNTTLVVDIIGGNFRYDGVTITKTDFSSSNKLERILAQCAQAVWTGSDSTSKLLLAHLMEKYNLTAVKAVDFTGWSDGHWLNPEAVITPKGLIIRPDESPVKFVRRAVDPVGVDLTINEFDASSIFKLNKPEVMWLLTGWFTASLLKPRLEAQNIRFPIMQVFGTKGSGKTSIIEKAMLPLFGQSPHGLDATTTGFVLRSHLAGTNAISTYFTEFRIQHGMDRFTRMILMAYDTGKDARGNADQTITEYNLSAPFFVTGEDMIPDHACKERIIPIRLDPRTIADSEASKAFESFKPRALTGRLLTKMATMDDKQFETIHRAIYNNLPVMPNRIRSNMSVVHMGNMIFSQIMGLQEPTLDYLKDSYGMLVKGSRTSVLADEFVTAIVNGLPNPMFATKFVKDLANNKHVLWMHFAPAHSWWMRTARAQGRNVMEADGISYQLKELPYYMGQMVDSETGATLTGIDLIQAKADGLDIPTTIKEIKFL